MLKVVTSEHIRLLRRIKGGAQQVFVLAVALRRDVRAVSRDVSLLEKAGLLRTSYQSNSLRTNRCWLFCPTHRKGNISRWVVLAQPLEKV
jgi:predicted transcriptional regulator